MSLPTSLLATATLNVPDFDQDNANNFFGVGLATEWMSGIAYIALILTIIGVVLSAGLWAVGAFSNNYTQSVNGKKGFLICAASALAIGLASYGVQYFFGAGQSINESNPQGGTP